MKYSKIASVQTDAIIHSLGAPEMWAKRTNDVKYHQVTCFGMGKTTKRNQPLKHPGEIINTNETTKSRRLNKRYPVVSYPWIFRTQMIVPRLRRFVPIRLISYPTLWTIRTQQIMTQNVQNKHKHLLHLSS